MILSVASTTFAASGRSESDEIIPFSGVVPSVTPLTSGTPSTCAFASLKMPADMIVYGAGAYSGRGLGRMLPFDDSGHEATQIDIVVNKNKPVALVLGSYEPTVWNIGWTEGTSIVAVLVSGYHHQLVAGLPKATPLIVSTHENRGPCGYFYFSSENNKESLYKLNSASQQLFGKPVDTLFAANNGAAYVGDANLNNTRIVSSNWKTVESYFVNAPIQGKPALDKAVKEGLLREMTDADFEIIGKAIEGLATQTQAPTKIVGFAAPPISDQLRPLWGRSAGRSFVIQKAFAFPQGLNGQPYVFMVPKGIATPTGNPGQSIVFDMNAPTLCQSAGCRQLLTMFNRDVSGFR